MNLKGFTVIELIMVIVIIGILAVMLIPRMIDTGTINTRESAEMVAADIRKTQELALADINSHNITFSSGNKSYIIDQGTANEQIVFLPPRVLITTSTVISFNKLGFPTGTPLLSISLGENTVTVTPETGRVTIS